MQPTRGEGSPDGPPWRRRAFLGAGTAGTLSVGAVALLVGADLQAAAAPIHPSRDVAILNAAIATEHVAIAAYAYCTRCGLLASDLAGIAQRFRDHHLTHCATLGGLVRKIGGEPAGMDAQANYESQLKVHALTRQDQLLTMAIRLELLAIHAYVDAIPALDHTDLARVVGRIVADEASHYAALSSALGMGARAG